MSCAASTASRCLVLHDFDKAGFSIAGTLAGVDTTIETSTSEPRRYEYRHDFEVIDLGLRLEDMREYSLESEPVYYKSDPSDNLEENGATPEEIEFLCGHGRHGQRVELNAFTSADFIRWIEAKLKANSIRKVVPAAETLAVAYRRAVQIEMVREQLTVMIQASNVAAEQAALPKNLVGIVRKALKADPTQPWDHAVATVAAANCKKRENGGPRKQAKSDAPADGTFTKSSPPAKKRPRGRPRKTDAAPPVSLAELGISEKLANQCLAVAAAPEGALEEYIEAVGSKEDGEITSDGFLTFCKKRATRKRTSACSQSTTEANE